ncbi:hypothetical protein ABPG74_006438 [Tetrahymena malaccensis]
MAQATNRFYLKQEKFVKIEQKSNQIKQSSIQFADSPCDSYFPGSQQLGNFSQLRQSICSSADTIDTPTANSFNTLTSKNQQTNSSNKKHHKSIIPQNFTQFVEAIKTLESKNSQENKDTDKALKQKKQNSQNEYLKTTNSQENQDLESSEDEEYSIWDNSFLKSQDFDCKNFLNKEGKQFTFYQLYRMRQCQLLGNISEKTTINEVFIISEHYKKPVKKSELIQQQQYLQEKYQLAHSDNSALTIQKQSSAQLISQIDQQSSNKFKRQYSQQSTDKIKKVISPSQIISEPQTSRNYYPKNSYNSPKNIFQNRQQQQYFFSNQQNLPQIGLQSQKSFYKLASQATNNSNSSGSNIFVNNNISFTQTERNVSKKTLKFSNLNETSLEEITPKSKQQIHNQQKLITYYLQQKIKNQEKQQQNECVDLSKKIPQKIQIKPQQIQIDSPYKSQSNSSQTSNLPKFFNKSQQRIKHYMQTHSYCNLKKFNI